MLAVGKFDGQITIVDLDLKQTVDFFDAGSQRIAVVKWHPNMDKIMAAGSFDGTVRIISYVDQHKILEGHKDRVRSLEWNSEIPWLLVSGADDSQIIVWDTRTRQ